MAASKATTTIELAPITVQRITIQVQGTASLICHRFSQKALGQMLDKQMSGTSAKTKQREAKVPIVDTIGGLHLMPACDGWHGTPESVVAYDLATGKDIDPQDYPKYTDGVGFRGKFGFPTVGIKAAAVSAAKLAGIAMTDARKAFHIPGELFEVLTEAGPVMRTDMVRVGMGTSDIRFRPEFVNWSAEIEVDFDTSVLTVESLITLFRRAGFSVGIGEWRCEKDGPFGAFEVVGSTIGEVRYL